jgi:hypothetical protein
LCGLKENDRERHTGGQAIDREMNIPCKKRERDLLIFRYKKREMVKERERGEYKRRRECPLDCERFRRITMISL